jgi:hypothetical protein
LRDFFYLQFAEKIVPQAKAVEDSVYGAVSKSEEYWKASVQLAHVSGFFFC